VIRERVFAFNDAEKVSVIDSLLWQ